MWIGYEYRNVAIGDEMIVEESRRWGNGDLFSRGKVTKVSNNYFWLGSKRYTRSMGRQHGDQQVRAYPFDQEKWDEMIERKEKAKQVKSQEERKRELEELQRREDFGCSHITDEDAQKVLGALRFYVNGGRKKVSDVIAAAGEATPEKPWPLYHQFRDARDHEQFITNVRVSDMFADMHQRLVGTAEAFEDGTTFEVRTDGETKVMSKAAGTKLAYVLKRELRSICAREANRYIESNCNEVGQKHLLSCLMNVADWKYSSFGWGSFNAKRED